MRTSLRRSFVCLGALLLFACNSSVETTSTSTGGAGGATGSTAMGGTRGSTTMTGGASTSSSSSTWGGSGGGQTCYECTCAYCFGGTHVEFGNTPCTSIPTSTCDGLDGGTDGGPAPYKECIETGVIENCV